MTKVIAHIHCVSLPDPDRSLMIVFASFPGSEILKSKFDLSHQSKHCNWLRIPHKSNLRLKYFRKLQP